MLPAEPVGDPAGRLTEEEVLASSVAPRRLSQLEVRSAGSVVGSAAAMVCVLLTNQPHKRLLLLILGVVLVASPIATRVWGQRMARSTHFSLHFYAWNATFAGLILVCGLLAASGPGMEIQVWLVTPLLSATVVCSPRLVGALGGQVVASYLLLEALTGRPGSTSQVLFATVGLALAAASAFAVSVRRQRQEVREKQLLVNVYELANRDALTGCLSRRALLDRFTHSVVTAHRYHRSLAALLIDVDHFKAINDEKGHSAGDEVLQGLGTVLAACTRDSDLVGRIGGDEFVVVLPEACAEEGLLVAHKIRAALLQGERPISVSIGIAILDPGDSIDELLARADAALYRAKREGRDQAALIP